MQTQDRGKVKQITEAIAASQKHLLSIQKPGGYWWAELESNVTITSEAVLLHKIWGTDKTRPLHKIEAYLRSQQREHGGWELFYGDGGELNTTVEAYMALRLLGVPAIDPALIKAKSLILQKGGISKTRIFTKLHLALIGCYNWRGLPSLPPWVMLLPANFPINIYELSSWARSSTVPLLIVFDRKPIFKIDNPINLDELYTEGVNNVKWELPKNGDWSDIFNILDDGFKLAESLNFVPFRNEGIKAAEKWILERQEATGDWGGIIPAMLNSLLALKCLDYDANDPIIYRGLKAVDNFAIETENSYCVQPCVSPVWDTAWAIRALIDSGFPADNPVIVKAGEWLIEKQILDYGDWNVKNKQGKPGAWAFEFDNRFYPDVDDSAVVVMALHQAKLPNENLKKQAIKRALNWIASMQCQPGGWAAFDIDNDQEWLNSVPYGDLKAMIDPNTVDVTARVIEMLGACNLSIQPNKLKKSLDYLLHEQEKEGCWFGRWGVNYIYGTSGVLSALALINPQKYRPHIEQGAAWLVKVQNLDGGWGETCFSYNDSSLKGKGDSTASQTAWALIGLIAAGEATGKMSLDSIEKGINYLLETQKSDGTWDESYFTGTGFPCHFYLKYHLYQQYFPLMALGKYQAIKQ
ncbi:squalene--hopene cyclase [Anabaena sp. UHCC 0451]|uniref:squalene--hopene cyclase n=1 Tax=Anabaena sp. UHCC 0451 TaxID=2055235 RepID=UPI002B1FBE6F|nr:squalene--hopene cyclase [Anabaena sp. UHCC 0451]MEA5577346.1 squalene--hopene cyclase [Anabaena sp. UHCC 0451]